jgi:hypothetical protein
MERCVSVRSISNSMRLFLVFYDVSNRSKGGSKSGLGIGQFVLNQLDEDDPGPVSI